MKRSLTGGNYRLRELGRGASAAFLIQVGGAGLAFIVQVFLARALGMEGFGQYAFVISWANLLGPLAVLGIGNSAVRFIPAYRANGEYSKLLGISRFSVITVTCISLGVMGIMQVIAWLYGGLGIASPIMMAIGMLIVPAVALLTLISGLLRGLKQIVQSLAWNAVIRPLFFIFFIVIAVFVLDRSLTPLDALLMNVIAAGLALLGIVVIIFRHWPLEARSGKQSYDLKNWLSVGVALLIVAIMQLVLNRVDVIMLGSLSGAREAGSYYAAARLTNLALFGLAAVNQILAPMISEHYALQDMQGLQRLMTLAARITAGLTLVLSVILILLGPYALGLFGKDFTEALPVVYVLLGGSLINAASGSVGYLMSMTRFHKEAAGFFVASAVIAIGLNFALIPKYGAVGAAISLAAALVFKNIASVLFVKFKLKLNTTIFSRLIPATS